MKPSSLVKTVVLIGGAALLTSGCVVRERVVYHPPPPGVVVEPAPSGEVAVTEAPPAPVVETVTIAPDPTFVWVGGAWFWEGRWVWHPGHWSHPPRGRTVWIAPHYGYRGGRHVWVRGYWR